MNETDTLKEIVDKLESITNGGENLLTQDDYGFIYSFLDAALEELPKT